MTKLILHVGTHKTATTSLQTFFAKNAKALMKQGIAVPRMVKYPVVRGSFASRNRNAHFLMYASVFDYRPQERLDEVAECVMKDFEIFVKAAARHDTILLSDERLWFEGTSNPGYWETLLGLVKAAGIDSVQLVVYLRRQDQFASSLWRQHIKWHERCSFKSYLRRENVRMALDYEKGLKDAEAVFGEGSVIVRAFDRAAFRGGDIYHDFCDAIGLEWDDEFVIPAEELNSNLTNVVAEIKRQVNTNEMYGATSGFMRPVAKHVSLEKVDKSFGKVWDAKGYEAFRGCYEAGNEAVVERYLGSEGASLVSWPEFESDKWSVSVEDELQMTIRMFTEALCMQDQAIRDLERKVEKQNAKIKKLNRASKALGTVSLAKRVKRKIGL